jgi:class 3 adenylate cyclase
VPPAIPVVNIAGAFVRAVDAVLAEKAATLSEAHRLRFRFALHQGLCRRDENGWVGEAINTACRLVGRAALREALTTAPDARMALIVSDDVHRSVIRHAYRLIDPASFAPVVINAEDLANETGWISVPGRAYPPAMPPAQRAGIVNRPTTVQGDQIVGFR